ncbi:unnamed protein product, partial [Callosobruchus maculatus]
FSGYTQDFGYDGSLGPVFWGKKFQNCIGKHQSPIDIEINNVKVKKFPTLKFENFDVPLEKVTLKNNGHTVVLTVAEGQLPSISGGPLEGKYLFAQLHFHWGKNDLEGSENLINNHSFPLELHMVFYKNDYTDFGHAANHSDGLTVLSYLFEAVDSENHRYDKFEEELVKVQNLGAIAEIHDFVPLHEFITDDKDNYFTYIGSLTTPPCSEVVIWIEFRNTVPLSHDQIQTFRQLSGSHGKLEHNFRPIQPLYDRIIYMNSSSCTSITKITLLVAVVGLLYF